MNHKKIYSYLLAAPVVAAGVVYATTSAEKQDLEKVQLPARVAAQFAKAKATATVNYPALLLDGASDGIPYGLRTTDINDQEVALAWLSPEPLDGYFDDFEDHDDFAVNSPGSIGWTYIDGDNRATYTWTACEYPNMGSKMAFIVMNPSQTTPSVADYPNYQTVSGKKMLVDFCAIDDVNNDYIISPELHFDSDFKISFRCKSYSSSFNLERVRVGYSTTGKNPSDFIYLTEDPYFEVPAVWTLLEYVVPQEAKYVCVNCVSDDAFMFMLDDLFVGTNNIRPNAPAHRKAASVSASATNPLVGFNVYRDGVKVNEEPVTEVRYTDTVDDYRTFNYTVTALYEDGSESAASEPLSVEVPDIHLLPFEDDFIKWTLAADKWSTPADAYGDNRWKIDYYEYGLVDPAATYAYSALEDYDQSLVTAELHTTDIASTYLRFEVKLRNTRLITTDYLSVEVTSDNGETWQEVTTITNENGAFDWTVFQYSLADLLTSKVFKVRFRAHGESAYYINYWYVDDIKIWNPEWTTAQIAVTTAAGPMAGCAVKLVADHGAVINDTTDAQGLINLPQIETGSYALSIAESNYNTVADTIEVVAGQSNSFNIHVNQPVLNLSTTALSAELAVEDQQSQTFTLKNTGDGTLTWRIPGRLPAGSGDATHRWDVQRSLDASGDLQSSVIFDGEYYYTCSSSYLYLGIYWKYDREGNFIEQFSIPEMYYMMYDMTFDGRYAYGSDYSNRLFQIDFDNRRVVREIEIEGQSSLVITHCTYDPNRDGFWVGSWNSIIFVDRNGVPQSLLTNISTTESLAIFGSAYDDVTPGGPYLWLSDETTANENTLDQIQLRQYSLATRSLTGVTHVVSDVPGYKVGTSSYSVNNICGLYSTADLEDGSLTLIGMLSQSPAHIFAYKLCDAQNWLGYTPKMGTLQPGEEQEVTVNIDARNGVVGESYSADLTVRSLPEIAEQSVNISYTAVRASATPRPVGLTAQADTLSVSLAWQAGSESTAPTGYRIYRDGNLIAEVDANVNAYVDQPALRGSYSYTVSALYDGKESVLSDAAEVTVKIGAPYYAPLQVEASITNNSQVDLQWVAPTLYAADTVTMAWTSGEHADELGLSDGGFFYFGTEWSAEDLIAQRNKQVTSLSVRIVNQVQYYGAMIYKDGVLIRQQANRATIHYGEYNEIVLTQPVTIEPGSDYRFCFIVMHSEDINPIALDGSSAVDGKGNLMSTDGKTWFTALEAGIDGNFNIRVKVEPTEASMSETLPTGYNVYCDGQRLNETPIEGYAYTDKLSTPGTHTYQVASVYDNRYESALSAAASVEVVEIANRVAPQTLNAQIERNRIVTLRWDYPSTETLPFPVDITSRPYTGVVDGPEYVYAFKGNNTEVGVATDGKSIYTSVYDEYNTTVAYIHRYSMDGTFVEQFAIDGLESVRNIAFDGSDFYVSDYLNSIYRVDMEKHAIVETIPISEYARHLCYVPDLDGGNGGFEVGDWETSIYINKSGAKIGSGPTYQGAAGTAYCNGRLYSFEQGGNTTYALYVYDFETGAKLDSIDLAQYVELDNISTAMAGGMSTYTTAEGHTFLLLCIQNSEQATQVAIMDLSSITGVAGYNVYCNGVQANEKLLSTRSFSETQSAEGLYTYQVQTVYIDGTTSDLSMATAQVEVTPVGECKVPTNLKVVPSTFGYNLLLSFADPDLTTSAAFFEGFENQNAGASVVIADGVNVNDVWTATTQLAYEGEQAMVADTTAEAYLIFPVKEGCNWMSFVARNSDDHNGTGSLDVLYSTHSSELSDFVYLQSFATTEAWSNCTATLPEKVTYVAIRKASAVEAQYVDAVRFNVGEPASNVFGYYVMRNGEQLNEEPICDIQYTDHNLEAGHYEYCVRQITMTSGLSDWSEPVSIDLDYDNGGRAPEQLSATYEDEGIRLNWSAPSLGEPIYLRHHSGRSSDAAGLPSGGAFYAGVRWSASDLAAYGALTVTDVQVYIHEIPDALFVLIYQGGNLMRQQYVSSIVQYSFNTVHLDEPLALDITKELRVVVYVEHNEITVPLGYDEGPALYGKGDLYSSDGSTWSTLSDNDIDGNWCISVGLSPFATVASSSDAVAAQNKPAATNTVAATAASQNAFMGYNVYCNREQLNDTLLQATTWLDTKTHVSPYLEYQVAAVYATSGESLSAKVRLYTTDIEAAALAGLNITVSGSDIRIYGAKAGTQLSLVAADGKVAYRAAVRDEYCTVVSTTELTAGVYVLRVGDQSLKVLVR